MPNPQHRIFAARAAVQYLGSAAEHPLSFNAARGLVWLALQPLVHHALIDAAVEEGLGQFRAMEFFLWEELDGMPEHAEPLDDDCAIDALLWLLGQRSGVTWVCDELALPTDAGPNGERTLVVSTVAPVPTRLRFDGFEVLRRLARSPITSTFDAMIAYLMGRAGHGTVREVTLGKAWQSPAYARAKRLGERLTALAGEPWFVGETTGKGDRTTFIGPKESTLVVETERAERALDAVPSIVGGYRRGAVLAALFDAGAVASLHIVS